MRQLHSGKFSRSPSRIAAALVAAFLLAPTAAWWVGFDPARATVPTTSNSITVAGNGAQTVFSFPFVGVASADISVLFTDASGNQTTLTQGPGATQYQVSLNAAVPPALWGIGGTVTYNPSGTPIAGGTTLTITRTLPIQQQTTLQNQASFGQYAQTTEQALDLQNMQLQQVAGTIGRTIVANPANSSPPNPLPPAAQVAGQGVCFDGTGNNLIGCVLPSSGVISSAMAPVVSAASIAAGRTALGLASMAQEAINGGTCGGATIQDDGSGNARVVFATVSDSSNQAVTCAFHGQQHMATGALVYTLPRANTLFNGFGFWVYALTQPVTFTPNAADNFSGLAGGASLVVPTGSVAWVSTNAQTSGTWLADVSTLQTAALSGTWYANSLSAPPLCGAIGLKITNGGTPNTTISLTADQIVMQTAAGLTVNRNSVSLTGISTTSGTVTSTANGMDGESPGTSNWLYVWAIDNGSGIAGLVSSAAGNGLTPTMPTGYTYKCRLGAMRVDGSGNLLRTLQVGTEAQYVVTAATNTTTLPVITSSFGTYWTANSVATFVPATAVRISLAAEFDLTWQETATAQTGTIHAGVAPNAAYSTPTASGRPPCSGFFAGATSGTGATISINNSTSMTCILDLETTNIFTGTGSSGTGALTNGSVLSALGWKDKVNAN